MTLGIKKILSFILLIASVLTFASCQKRSVHEAVGIQLMHGWGSNKASHEAMCKIYADFNPSNENTNLSFISAPNNDIIIGRADELLSVGEMSDIISTNGISSFVNHAVKNNMALDLMPFINNDLNFKNNIDSSVFSSWTEPSGSIHTIPDALEVMGYWYNSDIWQKAGVSSIPTSWIEFWDMCEKIQTWAEGNSNDITVFGIDKEQATEGLLLVAISSTEEGRNAAADIPHNLDSPIFKQALNKIKKIFSYSRQVNTIEDARQTFRDGEISIYCNGLWESEEVATGASASHIKYANFPTDSNETISYVSPASGYVLHKSGNLEREKASIDFLKYMLSEPIQTRIAIETGQVPCNPNINMTLLKNSRPLLASALVSARSSDIQISNIGSLWQGSFISSVKNNIVAFGRGAISEEEFINLLR